MSIYTLPNLWRSATAVLYNIHQLSYSSVLRCAVLSFAALLVVLGCPVYDHTRSTNCFNLICFVLLYCIVLHNIIQDLPTVLHCSALLSCIRSYKILPNVLQHNITDQISSHPATIHNLNIYKYTFTHP